MDDETVIDRAYRWAAESIAEMGYRPTPPALYNVTRWEDCAESAARKLRREVDALVLDELARLTGRGHTFERAVEIALCQKWEVSIADKSHPLLNKGKRSKARAELTYVMLWQPTEKELSTMRRRLARRTQAGDDV